MQQYIIKDLCINDQISVVNVEDLLGLTSLINSNSNSLSNNINISTDNIYQQQKPAFASASALTAYVSYISSAIQTQINTLHALITEINKKIAILPLTDSNGRFYMPDGIDTTTHKQLFRQLSIYTEPETGIVLLDIDGKQSVRNVNDNTFEQKNK